MSVQSVYQQKTIKNYQNFIVKDLKDQFIGMNIRPKVRIKTRKVNIDIFSNQILFKLIDYLFKFIQTKITNRERLKRKDIIYRKA